MTRRQEKRERRARAQWASDLQWLVRAEQGRRILANLVERSAYGKDVFTGNSHGNYMQGRQSLIGELVAEIKSIALTDFHRMEVEALSAQRIAADEPADEDEAE